ncbi:MAG: hypothetical protein KME45_33125 [Stenomitos rutilans HA7619-LM2]|jgi:hypothetical protein|nr:hypothetical protein [Stenomitos rutilans HA7619-LM2]
MVQKIRLPFTESDPRMGALSAFAYIPIKLTRQSPSLQLVGLLDTGSSVNVLPYEVGLALGLTWEAQNLIIPLGGNLVSAEAKAIILSAQIANFEPVDLAFAWTSDRSAPLILGQTNFGSASKNGGSSKVGRPLLLRTNYGMSALRSS